MFGLMMKCAVLWNKSHRRRGEGAAARRRRPWAEGLETRVVLSTTPYLQTNLVSDVPGLAQVTDPNLTNPWGVSFSSTSPFWVSNQGTNTSTLYAVTPNSVSAIPLVVGIPTTSSGPQGPTGQVHNGTTSFVLANGKPAAFIFANLNGTISAWNGGNTASVEWTTSGAVYTGLAIATNTAGSFLYAADGAQDRIDVFDDTFTPHTFAPNQFVDPQLPSGLVPFNIESLNGNLYVTYAPAGHANQAGAHAGQGAVAVFTTSGRFLGQPISGGPLAAPWGIALAPAGFGTFSGDLLVGNFAYSDSVINAFSPSGQVSTFQGTLKDPNGNAIANPGLWSLNFGNGVNAGDPNTLYFTAGIDGESHGLFGSLQAIPHLAAFAPVVPNLPNGALQSLTTVPPNGDVNPYGVAFVPQGFPTGGTISPGDILVSNFNNSSNQQGTGSTIVSITPSGSQSVFFQGSPGMGLTTALGVLKSGFVIVGNLPTTYDSNGNVVSIGQGSLTILDKNGNVVTTLSDSALLDGPWDLTINDQGSQAQVFVSNVLNGVVTRMDLSIPQGGDPIVQSLTRVASGYLTRTDPAALVVGPTGLAFNPTNGALYIASTGDNKIFGISNAATRTSDAGMGIVVYQDNAHLRGPLGLVLMPNGDLITSNGDAVNGDPTQPSELIEFTPAGRFVGQFSIDPAQGAAFGLAVSKVGSLLRLAAVEDGTNSVDVWTFDPPARTVAPVTHAGGSTSMGTVGDPTTGTAASTTQSSGTTGSPASSTASNTGSSVGVTTKHGKHARVTDLSRATRHAALPSARLSRAHGATDLGKHHRVAGPGELKSHHEKPSHPALPSGPMARLPIS
jgi:uncharacterized protein (TIGR03118 family)